MFRYGRQCEKEVDVDQVDLLPCTDKLKAPEKCEDYVDTATKARTTTFS